MHWSIDHGHFNLPVDVLNKCSGYLRFCHLFNFVQRTIMGNSWFANLNIFDEYLQWQRIGCFVEFRYRCLSVLSHNVRITHMLWNFLHDNSIFVFDHLLRIQHSFDLTYLYMRCFSYWWLFNYLVPVRIVFGLK